MRNTHMLTIPVGTKFPVTDYTERRKAATEFVRQIHPDGPAPVYPPDYAPALRVAYLSDGDRTTERWP